MKIDIIRKDNGPYPITYQDMLQNTGVYESQGVLGYFIVFPNLTGNICVACNREGGGWIVADKISWGNSLFRKVNVQITFS